MTQFSTSKWCLVGLAAFLVLPACGRTWFDAELAVCGNGVVEAGEQCDDGNTDGADACLATCQLATCGDGVLWVGVEECDDGNAVAGDGCTPDCRLEQARCGNGVVEGNEQCDDGNTLAGDGCGPDCRLETFCGNGILELGEECDDGNFVSGDGCDANCLLEGASCGNGVQELGEECDDGNASNSDACLNTCQRARCGDDFVWFGVEQCDDGNVLSGDGCSSLCRLEDSFCGNGVVEGTEQCDDGNTSNNDGCLSSCVQAFCGDSFLWAGVEQCDDGNNVAGDGCDATCQFETAVCGNGALEPGEQCDDGNASNSDGCLNTCRIATCGDGFLRAGVEQCDDGNNVSGDGCDATCRVEIQVCGNGVTEPGEQCDDGNASNNDGCLNTCRNATCGDGWLRIGVEQCDDGNVVPGDGCDAGCRLETFLCGNGILEPGEQCDDGNTSNNDACLNTCQNARCGDGRLWIGVEQCDDGNVVPGDGCSATCQLETASCGNGVVEPGEQCDDGNTSNTDACLNTCQNARCGDGRVWAGVEQCDDGNVVPGDGCDATCRIEGATCGNGVVEAGEQCDDGNASNNDGCLNSCRTASCGDGYIQLSTEACDDGNTTPGDGCDANCQLEQPSCVPDWAYLTCGTSDAWSTQWGNFTDAVDGYSCTARNESGPEYTYTFEAQQSGQVTVTLTATQDLDLFVLDGSSGVCDGNNCLTWGDQQVTFNAVAGQIYFLVVDGRNGAAGEYTVEMACSACGNGVVDPGEQCDDGNASNTDACLSSCQNARCGDGFVRAGVEQCDDGNTVPGDGCSPTCQLETTVCGNGVVEPGEQCDDGNASNTDSCLGNCQNARCGDGFLWQGVEQCDDGNTTSGDGCSATCEVEVPQCGNGVLEAGEQCDDGNTSNTDACLSTCRLATCGDGFVRTGVEQCDDGNTASGDGCSATCQIEAAVCGNGVPEPGEQCDDGNASNTDACLNTCRLATCGDGFVRAGVEQCDDGNTISGDGCSATCQLETASCGNGILEAGEQCDDGNTSNTDACLNTCRNATCGDGFVRTGVEQCDDGNTTPGDGCSATCQLETAVCGNGVLEAGEQCDDGNASNTDACLTTCRSATCGDGFVRTGVEQCDDGNTTPGDGCSATCQLEAAVCGNGVVEPGEQCDDGNSTNNDDCLNTCRNATCGDGIIWVWQEECDDGNTVPGDGCDASCQVESPTCVPDWAYLDCNGTDAWSTTGGGATDSIDSYPCAGWDESGPEYTYTFTAPADGPVTVSLDAGPLNLDLFVLTDAGGICDPANCVASGDTQVTFDAVANQTYFIVVDGRGGAGGSYTVDLFCEGCGNGIPEAGEQCDDGNASNSDDCLSDCTLATCGDGFVWQGVEQCDDGNTIDGDGCSATCTFETPTCVPDWDLTCGGGDNWSTAFQGATDSIDSYSCVSWDMSGPEYTYTFEAQTSEQVTATLASGAGNLDVFVLSAGPGGACDPQNCVAYGSTSATFQAQAGQTYYIVVDGRNGASGNYALQLSCSTCGNGVTEGTEECDDGNANETRYGLRVWQTGGVDFPVKPVERWQSATVFYGYISASAHTGYEAVGRSVAFLYRDRATGILSLFVVHGIDQNSSGQSQPVAEVQFHLTGFPQGTTRNRSDDAGTPGEFWQSGTSAYRGDWWFQNNTDGGVVSDIAYPDAWTIQIQPTWISGITEWVWVDSDDQLHPLDMSKPVFITADETPLTCREDCTLPECGDAILDPGEVCDDGNTTAGDGCAANCQSMP